ncbi:PAS domain-containing protein [filamentous cyanobacterium LEGE 11480]|uniref:histidine kinase n=1 Tax=Romeriopsis navalis LEGE 11480 TaxID=2777977 RepID=A0A928VLF5_9CYAN|nr:PAS domain-containing protein [Romeriopsis navalis]MBE9028690.1 PAS domain-containing protein [Romeriopsis navalis LEGE 11480]
MVDTLNHPPISIPGYTLTEKIYAKNHVEVYRGFADNDRAQSEQPIGSEAIEPEPVRPVVIKVLRSPYPSFNALVHFRNQYIIAKNLNIPGIIRPLALVPWNHSYALVMEDVGGIDLRKYGKAHDRLSVAQVLNIALQMADILHHLSQYRVLHKDINPANILIQPDTHQVWLMDFSLASLLPKEIQELQSPNSLEGTLAYIAPEQTGRMNRGIDYRADFYSLGVTLYELLAGELPFQSNDPMGLIHCHIAKTPVPTCALSAAIPKPLSDIVLKLMAKNAEDRYQSALGLKYDLQQCLHQWETSGRIEGVELGQRDLCDRFIIPEKLYGREAEVKTLLDAFERVAQGRSELMLVAGFSGIGKTAVVNEVHKPITRQKGYFIKGKFDQLNRNIPFSAFVQAFRSLIGQLLGETDVILADWKTKILTAVGDSGQVLIEVIPELELVIGVQPAVPELSGAAAQNRFNLLFGKFVQVFAKPEHPLVIFLDDLQWVDSASLNLLKTLMTESQSGHLLILGAYRDNEVSPAHSLVLALEDLKTQGAWVRTLTLEQLKLSDATQLVSDTLLHDIHRTASLSELIYQETQGNPFFITQLLQGLYDDGQIYFDIEARYWHCDFTQLSLNEDVVTFMGTRLRKLPKQTQEVLKVASCVGNQFDLATLAVVCERAQEQLAEDLWPALQLGLVLPESQIYKLFLRNSQTDERLQSSSQPLHLKYYFLHDRVQQAAYSLIPQSEREIVHYQIGQLLSKDQSQKSLEEKIFDIVGHFNLCETLIVKQSDRDELTHLNLIAGTRAKKSIAYQASLDYAKKGLSLLGENSWERRYQLTLDLHNLATESAYLTGDGSMTEQFTIEIKNHARQALDKVPSARTQIQLYASQHNYGLAITTAREILEELGVDLPSASSFEQVQQEYRKFQPYISQFSFESIVKLPLLKDPQKLAVAQLLLALGAPTIISDTNLFWLITLKLVRFSLENGNSPYSAYAYSSYGILVGLIDQDIEKYYQFGQLSLKVVDIFPQNPTKTRILNVVGAYTSYLKSHLRDARPLFSQAYALCLENGDFEYGGYSMQSKCQNLFFCGEMLASLQVEIISAHQAAQRLNHAHAKRLIKMLNQITSKLMAELGQPEDLESDAFDLEESVNSMIEDKDFFGLHHLYLYQSILQYLFSRQDQALLSIQLVQDNLDSVSGWPTEYIFYFYDSLICLSQINASSLIEETLDDQYLEKVRRNQEKYKIWASHAPMNFQHKYDLVEAERHRVLGNRVEALEFYDQAIAGAKKHQYLQEEALANELAAKFYIDWGKDRVAADYLQEAYYCYDRWGARAKTDDLEKRYPQLLQPILQPATESSDTLATLSSIAPVNLSTHASSNVTSTSTGGINQKFDLATVFKTSQLLTESIDLDELLEKLSRIMLQTSGTDHCAIIMPDGQENWQVRARATLEAMNLTPEPLDNRSALPVQLIQYVKNTQEMVVLDDANDDAVLVASHFRPHQSWSALGAPMLHRGRLIGVLYLQNESTTGVFTRDRITVINFLCAQSAIALDNAQLYRHLEQRVEERTQALQQSQGALAKLNHELEARVRERTAQLAASEGRLKTLFNQAADAVLLWGDKGFVDCNQAALDLFQYPSKDELLALQPYQVSPERQPDGQLSEDKAQVMMEHALERGSARFEWLHQRFDGENSWTEVTLTSIGYQEERLFHCTVRDVSDRKAAEQALKDTQAQFHRMTENVPGMIFRYVRHADGQDEMTYASSQVRELFEVEPEIALQNTVWDRIHPDDVPQISHKIQVSAETLEASEITYRVVLPQKGIRWVKNFASVERLDNGDTVWEGIVVDITDRKQAEEQLKALSQRLELALESAEIGIWEWNFHDDCLSWDDRMFEIYGISPETFEGTYQSFERCVHPDDLEQIRQKEQQEAKNPVHIEFRVIRPDGSIRHVASTVLKQYNHQGQPIRAVGTNIDITKRKHYEQQLQTLSNKLELAIESAQLGIWECNFQNHHLSWDDRMFEIYGISPETFEGTYQDWERLVHPDDLEQAQLKEGDKNPIFKEFRVVRSDGSIRHVMSTIVLQSDEHGQLIRAVGTNIDITERKKAELALQKTEAQFRRMTENVPGMIYRYVLRLDGSDGLTYVSSQVREIFELEPEAALQNITLIWERFQPDDIAKLQVSLQKSAVTLKPHSEEFRLLLPQKGLRWIQIMCRPERLENGDVAWYGVVVDISDRKQTEAKLQRTNEELIRATRMKDEFLANMSHELRTPLNAILGMTEGLEEGIFGEVNERQLNAINITNKSGSHLLELINEILDLAKIESGQVELVYAEVSVLYLCESSLTFVRQQAMKQNVHLHLKVPSHLPNIEVDERRMRQVLINLLNNAVKFTPEGGHVTLIVEPIPANITHDQDYLKLTIADTGIGIAPENLPKLFQPFIQIDSSLNRQYEGTGLGLALVKQIVELHGGDVTITSELNVGSHFMIELPYSTFSREGSANSQAASDLSLPMPEISSPKVSPLLLLAEDNEASIQTISSYLAAKGYRLAVAQNGEAAIELAQSELPDLILMDIQMPGMDGLVATQHIRQISALSQTPIVALTALAMEGDEERCLAAGADRYMSKPIRLRQLALLIQELLNPCGS